MLDFNNAAKEYSHSIESSIMFYKMLGNFLIELVDLNDPEIDKFFDKYEVSVQDKYPRKEG